MCVCGLSGGGGGLPAPGVLGGGGGGLAAPDALPQFGLICQDRPLREKLQGYFKCIA